jgi:riboflavin synthase
MFSGLIEATGRIVELTPLGQTSNDSYRLQLKTRDLDTSDVRLGDSIALNGVCLTVIRHEGEKLWFDVSSETLRCSTGFMAEQTVNLEKALQLGDRLGGHIVLGHVDGVGKITHYQQQGDSWDLVILVPELLAPFVATKGSITLNGVSLTTNQIEDTPMGCKVSLTLIPHTQRFTAFSQSKLDDSINIEIDMMARYACRYLAWTQTHSTPPHSQTAA